ncbi:hypothetical protein [Phytopseudomonas daroniae]|uniref:hypothetical protein n=1 Tax=Phytopseudomonas daroniae TaxID=2487519 RepID=UPI0010384739|nr:hypothetical protein [Pseudomonas daroniae]TBU75458.1 hypothetical protein DNK10_12505 [Pseudomonas daroniae]
MKSVFQAFSLLGCLMLAACSFEDGDYQAASLKLVEDFHNQAQRGEFSSIYNEAAPGLREGASEADFVRILRLIGKTMGSIERSELANRVPTKADDGRMLTLLVFNTQFSSGAATESFYIEKIDDEPKLFRYDMNSDALIQALITDQETRESASQNPVEN